MRTTEKWLIGMCVAASQVAWAQPAEVSKGYTSSVRTVDQLLKAENDALLAKAELESPAAPKVVKKGKEVKGEPRVISVIVESIFGTGDVLFARLRIGETTYEGLPVGAKGGPCQVKGIANQSVFLDTIDRTNSEICPVSAVWSGERPIPTSPLSVPNGANGVSQAQGVPQALIGAPGGTPFPLPPLPASNRVPLK